MAVWVICGQFESTRAGAMITQWMSILDHDWGPMQETILYDVYGQGWSSLDNTFKYKNLQSFGYVYH